MAVSARETGAPLCRGLFNSTKKNLLLGLAVLSFSGLTPSLGNTDLENSAASTAAAGALRARPQLVMDAAGNEKTRSGTTRRRGEESLLVTEDTLRKIQNVVILEKEGIVYCPIPKVASAEWKRSLRWMAGIDDWKGEHSNLHSIVENGLERLADRGLEETRLAFESDRLLRFLVVRDPAERLVSAFLNKCVTDGYISGRLSHDGSPSCSYLTLMPDLFPDTDKATLGTHERLRELVEGEPEDTFFQFVSGVWRNVNELGDPCKIHNHHFKPQSCFCDMPNLLSRFHVIPFTNMSAEAGDLASKLPEALPVSGVQGDSHGVELKNEGIVGAGGAAGGFGPNGSRTGVDEERREEINAFLTERFKRPQDADVKVTGAANRKDTFLSNRVMEVMHKMYALDYDLLGEYF